MLNNLEIVSFIKSVNIITYQDFKEHNTSKKLGLMMKIMASPFKQQFPKTKIQHRYSLRLAVYQVSNNQIIN